MNTTYKEKYEKAHKIQFDTGPRKGWVAPMASATIRYIKQGDWWEAGMDYEFWCGDHRGCVGPLGGKWPTPEAATDHYLAKLLKMLRGMVAQEVGHSCFTERQRDTAQELLSQVEQYMGLDAPDGQIDMFAMTGDAARETDDERL